MPAVNSNSRRRGISQLVVSAEHGQVAPATIRNTGGTSNITGTWSHGNWNTAVGGSGFQYLVQLQAGPISKFPPSGTGVSRCGRGEPGWRTPGEYWTGAGAEVIILRREPSHRQIPADTEGPLTPGAPVGQAGTSVTSG